MRDEALHGPGPRFHNAAAQNTALAALRDEADLDQLGEMMGERRFGNVEPGLHLVDRTAGRSRRGSLLFWEATDGSRVAISAGSLDQPTGLRIGQHIFAEHRADYDRAPPLPAEAVVPWEKSNTP